MLRKILVCLTAGVVLSAFLAGCGPEAGLTRQAELIQKPDLALKFNKNDITTYRVTTETTQSYKFEQPSLNKIDQKTTSTKVQVEFDQQIESVDPQGNALAVITIKAIKYLSENKSGIVFDFDSDRGADMEMPFAKLIGQSYRLWLSPNGNVKILDVKAARNAVRTGQDAEIAKGLLHDETITKRHRILALPDTGDVQTWSRLEPSHPLLLQRKSFEKIYSLEKIENHKAIVKMNAIPSSEPVEYTMKRSTNMEYLANIFDTEETYTGRMVLDLATGKVSQFNEKLAATYIAVDPPKAGKEDNDPDTLTMGLLSSVSVEIIK